MRYLLTVLSFLVCVAAAKAANTLDIYFIDVEGGQSTLVVSPSGQSLLIDTGFAGFNDRDPQRIAAAAKAAGLTRIDYLAITHFHGDHIGGVPGLVKLLPVGTFLDHGPSVESPGGNSYPAPYAAAMARSQHKVVVPGDKIPVKDLDITVVEAAGKPIERKATPNPYCAGLSRRPDNDKDEGGENPQSVGMVVEFGKFRFVDIGDATDNKQLGLLCPENRLGKADLYLTTRHGNHSPTAFRGMMPRVVIMNNGPRKGGLADTVKNVLASPGVEDLWQVHFAMENGNAGNGPETMIANMAEGEGDQGLYLKASASADGSFTITNPRTRLSKTYKASK